MTEKLSTTETITRRIDPSTRLDRCDAFKNRVIRSRQIGDIALAGRSGLTPDQNAILDTIKKHLEEVHPDVIEGHDFGCLGAIDAIQIGILLGIQKREETARLAEEARKEEEFRVAVDQCYDTTLLQMAS